MSVYPYNVCDLVYVTCDEDIVGLSRYNNDLVHIPQEKIFSIIDCHKS